MVKKKEQNTENPKPNNSHEQINGGFNFTAWGIHVVADDIDTAKKLVVEYFGINVDKDVPPPEIVSGDEDVVKEA